MTKAEGTSWRYSLRFRALALFGAGSIVLLGGMAFQAWRVADELVDRLLHEHGELARLTAGHLEWWMYQDLHRIAVIGGEALSDDRDASIAVEEHLQHATTGGLFEGRGFLLSANGALVLAAPSLDPAPLRRALLGLDLAQASATPERAVATSIEPAVLADGPALLVAQAATDTQGTIIGFAGAALRPGEIDLVALVGDPEILAKDTIQLIDAGGTVLASTDPTQLVQNADHDAVLARAIQEKVELHERCHDCHAGAGEGARETDVLAFAPLKNLPLGIAVRQREALALAPAASIRRGLLGAAVAIVFGFLLFAGLGLRSILRPISELIGAVRRVEAAHEREPLPAFGQSEVGELARALEHWRGRVAEATAAIEEQRRHALRRELLGRVLTAQEEERRRVARELHDTVSQELSAIRLLLERLGDTDGSGPTGTAIRDVENRVAGLMTTVRGIALDLRPLVLDRLGLVPALARHLERVESENGLVARIEVEGPEIDLNRDLKMALYRIFQESLQNVVQHADAEHVLVTVDLSESSVKLSIEDDGIGFDPAAPRVRPSERGEHGLGILGMEERATLRGGRLEIDAAPSQGTTVMATFPRSDVAKAGEAA